MDEPFGALDAQTKVFNGGGAFAYLGNGETDGYFVTNNIEEALYLADRILLLTNCPATVKKEYVIDMPRPRDLVSQQFLNLRKRNHGLYGQYIVKRGRT